MAFQETDLPDYQVDETQALPRYSMEASSSECLLTGRQGSCEWRYTSRHLKYTLGRKLWKLNGPAYGLYAAIEGSVEPMEPKYSLESLQITVQGRVRTDSYATTFLTHSVPIPVCPDSVQSTFSVPIPTSLAHEGKKAPCPPSFCSQSGHVLDVSYVVYFDAVLKGTRRRKFDKRIIPFYYLPKTNPEIPPVCVLPPASRHCENPPLFLKGPERMACFPIPPVRNSIYASPSPAIREYNIHFHLQFSLPSPATFTSGQTIPFMLSLSFHDEPYMANILCEGVAIHLYKRVGIYGVRGLAEESTRIASATLRKNSGWAEGVIVLKGEVTAGKAGAESSWSLSHVSHVKYILRASLRPPANLSPHIPAFIHEEEIAICTSSWGSIDREVISCCGSTTPAVGLSSSLRPIH